MNRSSKYLSLIGLMLTFLIYSIPLFADQFDRFFEESPFTAEAKSSIEAQHGNDIFNDAISSHSDISQSDVEFSIAEEKRREEVQKYNSQIIWETDAGFIHKKASDHTLSKTIYDNDSVAKTSVNLKKALWDKALGYSIKAENQNIQTARINQLGEKQRMIESVALAYLEYHAAKDMEAIAQRRTIMFTQIQKQIIKKEKLGYAASIDVVEVENQVQSANIALLEAQTNLQKTQINIHQLTDTLSYQLNSSDSLFQRNKDITLKPVDYLISSALDNNTELRSLYSEQMSLQKNIQSKRAGASPKLNLVSSLSQAWKHGDSDQDSFDFSLGMNMKVPLYTGGRVANKVKQAKLELLHAERRANSKRRNIITQINILSTEFSGSQSSYKSLIKLRKQMAKNLKLIKTAVPYGVRDNRHIYSALGSQFQLENSLIRQYYDLLKTKVKIMKITGDFGSKNLSQLRNLLLSS